MERLTNLTLHELADHIRIGDVTAEAAVNQVIERTNELKYLNSYTVFESNTLREAARAADNLRNQGGTLRPLHGVPIAVKDNIDVVGFSTSAGTPALVNHKPSKNADVVQALLKFGAIVPGKTNMHEIAMGATTNNAYFGTCRNPYAPDTVPGGSSGGSASAVAARLVPASLGTDTIGSVRIPASLCGIVGFRPSIGRYAQTGVVPLSRTRDTVGPMARCVRDIILLDSLLASPESAKRQAPPSVDKGNLRSARIGVPKGYFYQNMHPEVESAINDVLRTLVADGATLVDITIPALDSFDTMKSLSIIFCEVFDGISKYLEDSGSSITMHELKNQIASPDVKALVLGMRSQWESQKLEYGRQMNSERPVLQKAYSECFRIHGIDVLAFPTTVYPAGRLGNDGMLTSSGNVRFSQLAYLQNTDPGSYAGIPGISLPMGITCDGLPVALGLDAAFQNDERLLAISEVVELLLPSITAPSCS